MAMLNPGRLQTGTVDVKQIAAVLPQEGFRLQYSRSRNKAAAPYFAPRLSDTQVDLVTILALDFSWAATSLTSRWFWKR